MHKPRNLADSDTTEHDSLPKISKNSAKNNTVEEVKSQANVSKIPGNCNLSFNDDANDDIQTNKLEKRGNKAPLQKKYACHILI